MTNEGAYGDFQACGAITGNIQGLADPPTAQNIVDAFAYVQQQANAGNLADAGKFADAIKDYNSANSKFSSGDPKGAGKKLAKALKKLGQSLGC